MRKILAQVRLCRSMRLGTLAGLRVVSVRFGRAMVLADILERWLGLPEFLAHRFLQNASGDLWRVFIEDSLRQRLKESVLYFAFSRSLQPDDAGLLIETAV